MSLILNIDTSTETAGISLAEDGKELASARNGNQQDHAAWLHQAIKKLLNDTAHTLQQLDAVAITEGPGSYTGLRVGMAAAKGFCYSLNIPLITENTLKTMAQAAKSTSSAELICPMIDARRMEVFTAIYNPELQELMPASALVLDEYSFSEFLSGHTVLFTGNGSPKWRKVNRSASAFFGDPQPYLSTSLAYLSYQKFKQKQFTDIIYSEPFYLKGFYTHSKK